MVAQNLELVEELRFLVHQVRHRVGYGLRLKWHNGVSNVKIWLAQNASEGTSTLDMNWYSSRIEQTNCH